MKISMQVCLTGTPPGLRKSLASLHVDSTGLRVAETCLLTAATTTAALYTTCGSCASVDCCVGEDDLDYDCASLAEEVQFMPLRCR